LSGWLRSWGRSENLSRTPLFNHVQLAQRENEYNPRISDLAFEDLRVDTGTSKVDLSLYLTETERVEGSDRVQHGVFEAETIRRMKPAFHTLLEAILAEPGRTRCSAIADFCRRGIKLGCGSGTTDASGGDPEQPRAIQQLFEEQVERTPESVALVLKKSG